MIDFFELLTLEQKACAEKRKAEETRRIVGTIVAHDKEGRQFNKIVMLSEDLRVIDFGWPVRYDLEQLIDGIKNVRKDLYIDMGGRNHVGSPVYLKFDDLWLLLGKAQKLAETLRLENSLIFKDAVLAAKILAPIFRRKNWIWWSDQEKRFCSPTESEILEELQRLTHALLNDPESPIRAESGRLSVSFCSDTKEIVYELDDSSRKELL